LRSLHYSAAHSLSNIEIETHQQLVDLVWFWFRLGNLLLVRRP